MQNAHHFRSQAELYFELARRMSLRRDAEYYRVTAERLLSTAVDLEEHEEHPESASAASSGAPATKHR